MQIHANAHDGVPHIHSCPDHPNGSAAGGAACFWDSDHDATFKATHKAKAIAGLTKQHKDESDPEHKARIKNALGRL